MTRGLTVEITEQVYDLQVSTDVITTVEIFDFAVASNVVPASVFTNGPGNMIVSAAANDPRELDNISSPPSTGDVLTWDDTAGLKMEFKAPTGSGIITLTNKSGVTVDAGDTVIMDTTNASSFKTTTTEANPLVIGVALETILNNAAGKIAVANTTTVKVAGNVAIGQKLVTSTTVKYSKVAGGAVGIFGIALTAYAGGANGIVTVLLFPDMQRDDWLALIHAAPSKATPVNADEIGIWNSVTGLLNRLSWANIKVVLLTYFTPLFDLTYAGIIKMYGGTAAPPGYVLCDGASLVRADYAALFTAISTAYGTVDGSHFNVPDMRGVYPKGAGTTARAAGKNANGNYYAATLGVYVTDRMQGHKHSTVFLTGGSAQMGNAAFWLRPDTASDTGVPSTDGTNGTPRTGLTTEPQNLGVTFIIKT